MKRGRFKLPTSALEATDAYRARVDSVRGFVEERCRLDPAARVARTALHGAYQVWCEQTGRPAARAADFYEKLVDEWKLERRKNRGEHCLRGIELRAHR